MQLSREQARQFLIDYHHLSTNNSLIGKEGIIKYIKKVGCIQYDPLNVVGRNADLVLQSRILDYHETMLYELLYEDRRLCDGWDKVMSIYAIEDWPKMKRIRKERTIANYSALKYRNTTESLDYIDAIYNILKDSGPTFSREIKLGGVKKGRWASGRFANAALDHMFHSGLIGVAAKKNNQKQFDLIENLLPKSILNEPDPFKKESDFYKWYVKRRIDGVGLVWSKNGGAWLGEYLSNRKQREEVLEVLVNENELVTLTIEGLKDVFYISRENYSHLAKPLDSKDQSAQFLAPLDNLLWDRGLISKIFDFDYTWEVYVPKNKRKYGYYVLPVLYGNQLVARFEPILSDDTHQLLIKNWWWEKDVKVTSEMIAVIEEAILQFANYLGKVVNMDSIYRTIGI